MKKKTVIIALTAILALAGCGKSTPPVTNSSDEPVMDGPMGPITYTSVEDEPTEEDINPVVEWEEEQQNKTDACMAYLNAFGEYRNEKLDLEKYDEEIDDVGLYDLPDAYGNDIGLKYIWLANDINTDVLSEESIETLQSGDEYAIAKIVENTYQDVIIPEGATEDDETYYGNSVLGSSGPNMVPASSVVLQIETQERYLDTGDLEDPDGTEEREKELEEIAEKMQSEIGDKLDVPVYVQAVKPM